MNLLIIVKKSNIIWDEAIVTVESAKPFALCVKEEKHVRNMIAFDLGASNGRAILGQFDGKRIEMRELHRFENNYIEMNGVYYWDTPYLYSQLKQGLLAFRQGGFGPLDSFGIDTWGVDYGLLDKNGHLAGVPRSYRLGVQADVDAVIARIPAETLYARSGIDPSLTFNTLYQLCRRQREGDAALAAADRLLLTPDLLGYFLTGAAGTEYTIATTTQLYNPTARDWDWATIDELGLPRHIFTEIQPSGTVRGHLRPELCEELGLNPAAFVAVAQPRHRLLSGGHPRGGELRFLLQRHLVAVRGGDRPPRAGAGGGLRLLQRGHHPGRFPAAEEHHRPVDCSGVPPGLAEGGEGPVLG